MRGGKQLFMKTGGQVRPKMIHNKINYNAVKYELSNHHKTEIYRVSHFTTPLFHGSVPLRRLKCVLKEHHLQVSPTLVAKEPPVKKRKSI